MIVATAGHVDHGKTTLVQALTGIDTDRLAEEKRRGLSIEPGFAYRPLGAGQVLGFVDVPGHRRFIHNMLSSIAGVDLALLVVAADDGPMPQTHEHLQILELLGVREVLAVSSCVDRVDGPRRRSALADMHALLAESPYAGAEVLEVSARSGEGLASLRERLETRARAHRRPLQTAGRCFRLAVDRSFSLPGVGTVVTGTVFSGAAAVENRLRLARSGREVRLRGLHVAGQPAGRAVAGDRAALNIAGNNVSAADVRRGDWLLEAAAAHTAERLDVRLRLLPGVARPLRHWSEVHLHLGAAHTCARVAVLGAGSIAPGDEALAQLVLTAPLHAMHGDRFVLRDQSASQTVAGGRVLDPLAPRRGRARRARLACLQALSAETPGAALCALLAVSPDGVDLDRFARTVNLDESGLDDLLASQPHRLALAQGERFAVSPEHWQSLRSAAVQAVLAWHAERPGSQGLNLAALARALPGSPPATLATAVAAELVQDGELARRGMLLHAPGHVVRLTPEQQRLWEAAIVQLAAEGASSPSLHPLAATLEAPVERLREALSAAVEAGLAVCIARNRYLSAATVRSYAEKVEALAAAQGEKGFRAAAFRDRTRVGRNFAIDLLEFFDRAGLTRREGERRWLRRRAAQVFGEETTIHGQIIDS